MTHCLNFQTSPTNRREYLAQLACGFGGVALAGLAAERGYADVAGAPVLPATHHAPKPGISSSCIWMVAHLSGSVRSQAQAHEEHGEPMKMKVQATQFDNNGKIMKSPWEFTQHGESGLPFSSLILTSPRRPTICV